MHRLAVLRNAALAFAGILLATQAQAQTWPSQPVKIVVPATPGGAISHDQRGAPAG
jgi:tripartite-type tricarboxylate transporter receptor subunit TctC